MFEAMRSKELAEFLGVSDRYIRNLTDKALKEGKRFIEYKGRVIYFREVEGVGGNSGRIYEYYDITDINTPSKKGMSIACPDVPDIDLKRPSVDEKLAIVKYYLERGVSYLAIAKSLILKKGAFDVKAESLERKIKMWVKKFREMGIDGLKDKRGGRRFSKIREDFFIASLVKAGRVKSAYMRYAYMEAKQRGEKFDVFDYKASITYQSFLKHFNKVKSDPVIKAIMRGKDKLDNLIPHFKVPRYYPNYMWEIDATSVDLMVKVPVVDGREVWYERVESEEFKLKRMSLIGVVDRFSGARVYILRRSDTSYSDVRLIEKAIRVLGMPENIKGDNGKNYVSEHFQSVLKRLGVNYIASSPYKGREKGFVERGFRSIQHSGVFENLPGFIGHNVEERNTIEAQAVRKSERRGGKPTFLKEEFMWWWEAERVIDGIINKMYGDKMELHGEIGEVPENLHYKLGKVYKRKLQLGGVYLDGRYYIPDSEVWNYLSVGEEVEVYEEIDDISKVYIRVEIDGIERFIECVDENVANISVEEAKERVKVYKEKVLKEAKRKVKKGEVVLKELQKEVIEQAKRESMLEEVKSVKKEREKEVSQDDVFEFVIKDVVGI